MRLSVVIPLFNEAENLEPLSERLTATMERIGCDYELIFVDDGSTDESLAVLDRLADLDPNTKYLSFSRNFGHETASTAGLDIADGDAVILMDADLQDPPELIERMLEPWLQGFDVVYATRTRRRGESWIKRSTSFLFYRLMRSVASIDLPLDTGDFRLMDRRVVEAFRQMPERERFVRGLITWLGFRQTSVAYDRAARHAGDSKYSWWKLARLACDAIFGFSVLPLRAISVIGLAALAVAVIFGGVSLGSHAVRGTDPSGSALTNLCLMFFSGTQLVAIGVLGEYLGKVHREVQNRPLYLIDRQRGWSNVTSQRATTERANRRVTLARADAGQSHPRAHGRALASDRAPL